MACCSYKGLIIVAFKSKYHVFIQVHMRWTSRIHLLMLAAYDVISRVFSQKAVVNAYYNTNPDTFSIRDDDDPIRMIQKMRKAPAMGLSTYSFRLLSWRM